MRSCGGCTVCCKIMAVSELGKPEDKWCGFCKIGKGCTNYQDRPQSCGEFACVWLQTPQLDDTYRPDRIRVMLFEYDGKVTAYCEQPDRWRNPKVLHMLRYAARKNGHSIVRAGKRMWIVKPDEEYEVDEANIMRTPQEIRVAVPITEPPWPT